MKNIILFFLSFLFSFQVNGQIWEDNVVDINKDASYFDLVESFNQYRKEIKYTKGNGYKPYARNIYFLESRIPDNGVFPSNILWEEWLKLKKSSKTANSSNWTPLGPFDVPIIQSNGKRRGNGRVNCITFHPTDPDIFWIGAPGGGLWKTTDGGDNWTTNTDNLPVLGISDMVINPNNTDIMYIVTGDADGSDTYSIGILKSIDGGLSWNTTSLSYSVSQSIDISKLELNPNNPDSIFAVTDDNIFVSADAGDSWNTVGPNGRWRDIHYKPENTNVLYAAKQTTGTSNVYRSLDGGSTWQVSNNGVLPSGKRRPLIAVTPSNPEVVYALFSDGSYGYHGLYKSVDAGDNWVLQSSSPNILGREIDGSDVGGQSWYDLSLAVSTTDENHILVGGINLWESIDGGVTWGIEGSSGNKPSYSYMHVDQHATEFNPINNIAYVGNDGGIYKYFTQLNTWLDISDGLEISQFYKLGVSSLNSGTLVVGAQDNGTERLSNNIWDAIRGSDGMECIIDQYDDDIIFSSSQYGGLRVTYNGGNDWDNVKPVSYEGAWVTPYKMHPQDNNILVSGYNAVYKSVNGALSWDSISPPFGELKTIALAPSNIDYIYAATYTGLWLTKDDGINWNYIKTGLPSGTISDVTVASNNEDRVFVTLSSYTENQKVYESTNAGNTWTNISGTNLPNLPVNCIVFQSYTNDDLYIGTDIGVWRKDNNMTEWQMFNNGLPSVSVSELEIQYLSGKLKAATFGRGVWESDLHTAPSAISDFDRELFSVYPNPVEDKLIVKTPFGQKNFLLKIYSLTGQLVLEINLENDVQIVDCSNLKTGCYIYKIGNNKGEFISNKLLVY